MLREFPLAGRMADRVGPAGLPLHEPPPVRTAATVMLLREGDRGPQVFAFRRVPRMAFAPGMLVFPGGSVDPCDADPAVPFAGVVAAGLRPVLAAAVRETFEECGVLLAQSTSGPAPDAAELASPAWEERRGALAAGVVPLGAVLADAGLAIDPAAAGALGPLGHAGVREPPLRHLVLRRRSPRRAGGARSGRRG